MRQIATTTPVAIAAMRAGCSDTTYGEFAIFGAPLDGELAVAGWSAATPEVHIADPIPGASVRAGLLRDVAVTFDMVRARLALTR